MTPERLEHLAELADEAAEWAAAGAADGHAPTGWRRRFADTAKIARVLAAYDRAEQADSTDRHAARAAALAHHELGHSVLNGRRRR